MFITYILAYLLHGAESFLRSYLVLQLIKKFPAFYGTRKFITILTSARHLSLSWANSIQPHLLKIHLNIILPSTSWSPQWFLSLRFPHQNLVHNSPFLHTCHMPAHLNLLDFITRTILGEQYRSLSSSLCNFLHSPVTPSLLGPNILLSTLFSNTLSLCSSRNVSDQVSHPYAFSKHKTPPKFSTFPLIFLTSLRSTVSPAHLYQKDERAHLGTLEAVLSFCSLQ